MLPDEIELNDSLMSSFNETLDAENKYSKVDLLKFVEDGHLLKRLSVQVAAATDIPVSTVFLMGLGVFGSMAAREFCVLYPNGDRLPIGIYVVAEQPPGTGKTWCLSVFQAPFYKIHKSMRDITSKKIKQFESKIEANYSFNDDELEEFAQLKELAARLAVPLFVSNSTPEGLEKTLDQTHGFFSAVSSEQGLFGSLFGGTYKTGESTANNNDLVLNGFDGGYVSSLRVTRNGYCGNAVGGVACFAQHGSIERLHTASNGTGLSERFLPLVEPHALGTRDHSRHRKIDKPITDEYGLVCGFIQEVFDGPRDFYMLTPLNISDVGHGMIADYQNEIEPYLVDGGRFSYISLRGAASKINMQIMKLAAILHLTERVDNCLDIPDKHIKSAIGIAHELLEANLALCRDKGLMGAKAEFSGILSLFEHDPRPRTDRQIVQAISKKSPFREFSGNKSVLIRATLEEMVAQKLLVLFFLEGKPTYQLAQ